MGLVLDEPTAHDERVEVEGISLLMGSEVAKTIRAQGSLLIDYKSNLWSKGFRLSLAGQSAC